MERLGKTRHRREGRRLSEQEVSESYPANLAVSWQRPRKPGLASKAFGAALQPRLRSE